MNEYKLYELQEVYKVEILGRYFYLFMKGKKILITMVAALGLFTTAMAMPRVAHATSNNVYDMSEWQHALTDQQVKGLKNEVPFVILRVQYGSAYADKVFQHNRDLMDKYGIPYGVYSFSQYENPSDAAYEARELYNRAPNARFYVNDYEVQTVKSGGTNKSTEAWVNALRPLVGKRKILFYSYASFMMTNASYAVSDYDGYWIAAYSNAEPQREHVLWQYTDHFHSNALNENLDASSLTQRNADWFIGDSHDANNPASEPTPHISNDSKDSQKKQKRSTNDQKDHQQSNAQNKASSKQNIEVADSNKPAPKKHHKKVNKKKKVQRIANYTRVSINSTIKSGTGLKLYLHVPGDNHFSGKNKVKYDSNKYGAKPVHLDITAVNKKNGYRYYRAVRGKRVLGWINSNGLGPNISYQKFYTTKTVKARPAYNFYAHVAGGDFVNNKLKHYGRTYANKRIKIKSRAIKQGWNSYYYKAYYRGHFIGWVYQPSLRK